MQDNFLQKEVQSNSENVFVSKELENRLAISSNNEVNNCLIYTKNKTLKGTVLRQKSCSRKNIFTIDIGKENITGINIDHFERLVINNICELNLSNKLNKFTVYLSNNRHYHVKLNIIVEGEIKNEI